MPDVHGSLAGLGDKMNYQLSDGAKQGWSNLFLVIGGSVSLGMLTESQPAGWLFFFISILIIRNF